MPRDVSLQNGWAKASPALEHNLVGSGNGLIRCQWNKDGRAVADLNLDQGRAFRLGAALDCGSHF
jgi:hypothetical protein